MSSKLDKVSIATFVMFLFIKFLKVNFRVFRSPAAKIIFSSYKKHCRRLSMMLTDINEGVYKKVFYIKEVI